VLGCPIRSELAASTVLGLDTHQFSNLILEGSSLVPELSNLVQKDPDLAGKSFGEIVDIFWRCAAGIVGTSVDFVGHLLGPGPAKMLGWLDAKAM